MAKLEIKECPSCVRQVAFWCNRKVCVHCRHAELQMPEHKAKAKGWRLVNEAIRAGRLVRQPCEVCGEVRTDAHHDDYSKPLAVRWLCRPHHRQHHQTAKSAA